MPERVLSAGVVVVCQQQGEWRVLLLRAYNYWDCPKGVVESGEAPLITARREVREETGIDDLAFRWGEEFVETPPYAKNKVARYYVAETRSAAIKLPVSAELGRPEHHEYRWFSWEDARKVTVARVAEVLRWAESRIASD